MKRLLLVLLFLFSASTANAGPWTRDAGGLYANLTYSFLSADSLYTPSGDKVPLGNRYEQLNVGLYAEAGIVDRYLTAILDASLYRRSRLAGQGLTYGMGDMRLGLATGIVTEPFRLTLSAYAGLPTGDPHPDANSGDPEGAELIAASLPTGDGEADGELELSIGKSFESLWGVRHYATARLGYWLRSEGIGDSIRWGAELGLQPPLAYLDRIWFIARLNAVEPLDDAGGSGTSVSGMGDGVGYRGFGLEINAEVWNGVGLLAGMDGAFSAKSQPAAPVWRLGVSYQR